VEPEYCVKFRPESKSKIAPSLTTALLNKNVVAAPVTSRMASPVTVIVAALTALRPAVFSVFAPVTVNVGDVLLVYPTSN
jgi:hypothetical protein